MACSPLSCGPVPFFAKGVCYLLRKWIVCFCITLFGCGVSFAAGSQVQGKAVDTTGATIPNAIVSLTDLTTSKVLHTTTNAQGQFAFTDVPADPQILTIEKSGFESFTQRVSSTATVAATLHMATLSESVVVRG